MQNPSPVNLQPPSESRGKWHAESRDEDGHLCRSCVFYDDEDMVRFVNECNEDGQTITIWPHTKIKNA